MKLKQNFKYLLFCVRANNNKDKYLMKVRIDKLKQQKNQMIEANSIHTDEQTQQRIQNSQQQPNDFQTALILGAVILIVIGVSVYVYAIVSINGTDYQSYLQNNSTQTSYTPKLRNNIFPDANSFNKIFQSNKLGIDRGASSLNKLNLQYVQQFKKISTQISVNKLERSKQFLKNLTEPIDQKYYKEQKQSYERDYQISKYQIEKPICIVVPTYNNIEGQRYRRNIDSILQQEYANYRVIVIDDASEDNTGGILEEYLRNNPVYLSGRIKIQKNLERKMALPNILDAAYNYCNPQDIFMIIDGDDYLLGKYVFKLFNAAYSRTDSWIVYSNFLTVSGKIGYSRRYPLEIIQKNYFRKVLFVISHLRTYYTKLLHLIKKQDLFDENGQYFHAANDVALLMPILQMGRQHIQYIPQINYYYNSNTGHNNHVQKKKQQVKNDKLVRMKQIYDKIDQLFPENVIENKGDLLYNKLFI